MLLVASVAGGTGGLSSAAFNVAWPTVAPGDLALFHWVFATATPASTLPGFLTQGGVNHVAGGGRQEVWAHPCDGSETGSLTATCTGANRHCGILSIIRAQDLVTPINALSTFAQSGVSPNYDCPSATATVPDTVALVSVAERSGTNAATSFTPPAGFSEPAPPNGEVFSAGSGGTGIAVANDGFTPGRPTGVVNPANYSSDNATGTQAASTITVLIAPLVVPAGIIPAPTRPRVFVIPPATWRRGQSTPVADLPTPATLPRATRRRVPLAQARGKVMNFLAPPPVPAPPAWVSGATRASIGRLLHRRGGQAPASAPVPSAPVPVGPSRVHRRRTAVIRRGSAPSVPLTLAAPPAAPAWPVTGVARGARVLLASTTRRRTRHMTFSASGVVIVARSGVLWPSDSGSVMSTGDTAATLIPSDDGGELV